jgi:leader peptidase (prepilin peptidase)/N-methyltransferase
MLGIVGAIVAAATGPPVAAVTATVPEDGRIGLRTAWWRGVGASGQRIAVHTAAAGIAAGVTAAYVGWSTTLPAWWVLATLGVGLAVADIEHHRLPNILIAPIALTALTCVVIGAIVARTGGALLRATAAAAVVTVVLAGLAMVTGGIGGGDVKLPGGWRSCWPGTAGPSYSSGCCAACSSPQPPDLS